MARYWCAIIWLGLAVGEVLSNASSTLEGVSVSTGLSTGGTSGTLPASDDQTTRRNRSGLLTLRGLFQDLEAYRRRLSTTSTSNEASSNRGGAPTAPPLVPLAFTRDPVCNMSAFVKQARACWKEAAVYSEKPEGICAPKVDAKFRRCLVRVTRQTSCEDDERANERIRREVDSQRAHCIGAPARRAAAAPANIVAPSASRFLFAGASLLALCRLPAN